MPAHKPISQGLQTSYMTLDDKSHQCKTVPMDRFVAIKASINGSLVPTFIVDRQSLDAMSTDKLDGVVKRIVNPHGLFTLDGYQVTPIDGQVLATLLEDGERRAKDQGRYE